jgi:phosphoribosylanthranilate isomerase
VHRTRIKICGICRPQDAVVAARYGADAVGIVLDPNAGRYVSLDLARQIFAAVPPFVTPVGLFVNASAAEIKRVVAEIPFSAVQLHGDESPSVVADLKPIRIIKAVHLKPGDPAPLKKWRDAIRDLKLTNLVGLLIESARAGAAPGGTGVASNFTSIRQLQDADQFAELPPVIIAGGLTAHNVADVVQRLHPFAVDVSSGVESVKHQKSAEEIQAFVRAVRQADGGGHA